VTLCHDLISTSIKKHCNQLQNTTIVRISATCYYQQKNGPPQRIEATHIQVGKNLAACISAIKGQLFDHTSAFFSSDTLHRTQKMASSAQKLPAFMARNRWLSFYSGG
jgi:hypothetical protein